MEVSGKGLFLAPLASDTGRENAQTGRDRDAKRVEPTRSVRRLKFNEAEERFLFWCHVLELPDPMRNWRFHESRKWELDFAWPELRIGAEIQGGIFLPGGGAHSRPVNIRRDLEKHNALLDLDWRVWHFMPEHITRGQAAQHMAQVLRSASNDWMESR